MSLAFEAKFTPSSSQTSTPDFSNTGLASIALIFLWGDVNAACQSGVLWSNPLVYPVLAMVAVGFIGLAVWRVLLGRQLVPGAFG